MPPTALTYRPDALRCLTPGRWRGVVIVGMSGGRIHTNVLTILFFLTAILPTHAKLSCPMVKAAIEQEKSELATTSEREQAQPMVKMQVERLPDLNIPRQGHSVFCIGGEVVATHTPAFGFSRCVLHW